MRQFIEKMEKRGKVVRIKRAVDGDFEVANILNAFEGQIVFFEKVKGFSAPVVGNLCSSRDLIAEAIGCKKDEVVAKLVRAIANPKQPALVTKPACQEVVEKDVDLTKLPFLKYSKIDGGRYVASAVVTVKDPELGRNLAFHRLMLVAKDKLVGRLIEGRGTRTALEKSKGDLPVAIAIGNSTQVLLGAAISLKPQVDELSIANSIGKVDLAKCITCDLEVPADAEYVLEGVIKKNEFHGEGPFLDLTGTADDVIRQEPLIEIRKITHRRDPLFQVLLPGKAEHKLLMGMPREPTIFTEVNKVCKCLDVSITEGGCSWLHAIVKIEKKNPDDGVKAIEAAFRGHGSLKHCVVVDDDIDIYDPRSVEWAVATRFQADKNSVIKPNQPGSSLDPSGIHEKGKKTLTCKAGFDATIPADKDKGEFKIVDYPKIRKEDYL